MGELKVLILGDGLLGMEINKQTGWEFVSRKQGTFNINNMIWDLSKHHPDVIINCIANTDTYSNNKDAHWGINYKFISDLIKYCNENKIKLVHISTDYVYSGSISNASEDDVPVHCNNWYGYTKLLGDGLVQLQSNNYLLCRCTHKPYPFPYESAWINQIGNFDYVNKIAKLIIEMINNNLSGLYNVGTETKTMFDLAKQTKNINPILAPNHVPKDQSMNINKLEIDLKKPFFSVAIPAYGYNGKGAEFLDFNLNILNKQTFKNFEIVISDHSTDDTIKNVYLKWVNLLNIKYFKNESGRGIISPNINNAMKKCNGKWIKVLFQDDFLYDENSLKIQSEILEDNSNIKWLITTFCHSNDGISYYRLYNPKWNDLIWTGNNTLGNPSNITLKNEDIIFFDENLNWLVDCEYYYRMFIKHGKPTIINELTVVNRTHGGGLSNTTPEDLKNKELKILTEKYA